MSRNQRLEARKLRVLNCKHQKVGKGKLAVDSSKRLKRLSWLSFSNFKYSVVDLPLLVFAVFNRKKKFNLFAVCLLLKVFLDIGIRSSYYAINYWPAIIQITLL